jgi:hypothetical protein
MSLLFWAFFIFMAYVYIHHRNDIQDDYESVFYVGIGTNKRVFQTLSRNRFWKNIVKKHGFTGFIIKDDLTWEEACSIEKDLIKFYGRKDLGLGNLCNLTDGGDGQLGCYPSEQTKEKMRKNNKHTQSFLGKKLTEEHRKNISKGNMGKKMSPESILKMKEGQKIVNSFVQTRINKSNAQKGKKLSEEHKLKISQKNKGKGIGKIMSEETRKKISFIHKNKIISEETRIKLRNRTGEKNGNWGNRGIKNKLSKKVAQIDRTNNNIIKIFNSVKEASEETNIKQAGIANCARKIKNHSHAGGYVWEYLK